MLRPDEANLVRYVEELDLEVPGKSEQATHDEKRCAKTTFFLYALSNISIPY